MKMYAYLAAAALAAGVVGCKNESTSSNTPGQTPGDRVAGTVKDGVNATTQGAANAGAAVSGAAKDTGSAISNAGQDAKDAANRGMDKAKDATANATDKAREATASASQDAKEGTAKAAESAKQAGRDVKDAAKDSKDAVVAGASLSGASDVTGIRGTLEGVVTNALNANDLDKMTGYLTDADKQRLTGLDPKALTAGVDQFKKAWGQKYSGDVFGVMAADQVFSDQFVTLTASGQTTADAKGKTGQAVIKASHGLPEVQVPVVAQDGKWKLDLPDTVDAATLQQNLSKAVQELNAASGQWPADKVQASQHVAHRILMAVTNTQAK